MEFNFKTKEEAIEARRKLDDVIDGFGLDKYTKLLLDEFNMLDEVKGDDVAEELMSKCAIFENILYNWKHVFFLYIDTLSSRRIDAMVGNTSKDLHIKKKLHDANKELTKVRIRSARQSCDILRVMNSKSNDDTINKVMDNYFELYSQLFSILNSLSKDVMELSDLKIAVLRKSDRGNIFVDGGKYSIHTEK
jgi:hypothetical protein